jgi:hypothetical protein
MTLGHPSPAPSRRELSSRLTGWRICDAPGEREGPGAKRWEGEGLPYSAFSIASALDTSTWLGTCSTLSAFTVPSSTSIE